MPMSLRLKQDYMFALEEVVADVAGRILSYNGTIVDTKLVRGHEESSIDRLAYEWMLGSLEEKFSRFHKNDRFRGKYLFELHELQDIDNGHSEEENGGKRVLRIDEIDGTTNTKRCKTSVLGYSPLATVSVALCDNEAMDSILLGVVYDMHNGNVFSGVQVDGGYLAFCDRVLLDPKDFVDKKGDSNFRVMVVGYSNRERRRKGDIEQAIVDADPGIKVYDGSRATTVDILSILRNQYDAYVDPRGLWPPESGAMLHPYDVAGVIPIALGCGLEISDIHGRQIETQGKDDAVLTLIVARKGLRDRLVEALKGGH